jgi:hypothetical protein
MSPKVLRPPRLARLRRATWLRLLRSCTPDRAPFSIAVSLAGEGAWIWLCDKPHGGGCETAPNFNGAAPQRGALRGSPTQTSSIRTPSRTMIVRVRVRASHLRQRDRGRRRRGRQRAATIRRRSSSRRRPTRQASGHGRECGLYCGIPSANRMMASFDANLLSVMRVTAVNWRGEFRAYSPGSGGVI